VLSATINQNKKNKNNYVFSQRKDAFLFLPITEVLA